MPGMLTVDQPDTFTTPPIVMAVFPKIKFNSTEQDVTRDGERKWVVQAAVTYRPQFDGMKPVSEVIEVTVVGAQPSVAGPAQFTRLQAGVSAPEQRERRDGGTRVVGGKLWWSAAGVEPAGSSNGRATASASAA